jgi:hypothetical protein
VLRADQSFPRRAPIDVTLRPAVSAESESWEASIRLRDHVRGIIAEATGEALVDEGR